MIVVASVLREDRRLAHRAPRARARLRDALPRAAPLGLRGDRLRRRHLRAARDPAGARDRRRRARLVGRDRPRDRLREPADDRQRRRGRPDRDHASRCGSATRWRSQGTKGVVEEIGLTYTWIRTRDNDRLVVPNEKLASETIRNSTIRSARDARRGARSRCPRRRPAAVVESLKAEGEEVYVTDLGGQRRRSWCASGSPARAPPSAAASDLRIARRRAAAAAGASA